jgi:hypothetical protein
MTQKHKALTHESQALTKSMVANFDDDLIDLDPQSNPSAQKEFHINCALLKLLESNWLQPSAPLTTSPQLDSVPILPKITQAQLKLWKAAIARQEHIEKQKRHNALDSNNQMNVDISAPETEHGKFVQNLLDPVVVPVSEIISSALPAIDSCANVIQDICLTSSLNKKRGVAFLLITNAFFEFLDNKLTKKNAIDQPNFKPYLCLLLSEPGGTGKTHVVCSVQQVMKLYDCEHNIWFLAPSGSAAALIDGMTVHKGLSIKIQNKIK